MLKTYKRIFEINPENLNDLMTHAQFGVIIRPVRTGEKNTYVIETADPNEKRAVDKIVKLFAID